MGIEVEGTRSEGSDHKINETITDVIMLFPGTTDPINVEAGVNSATSYFSPSKDPASLGLLVSYWDGEGCKEFFPALAKFCSAHPTIALYTAMGWSGHNARISREIVRKYQANRLCLPTQKGKVPAWYGPSWRKRPIAFHLIGHSHGGNVINEFTKHIASPEMAGKWPAKWLVKTVIYLSTPFFETMHQVNPGKFDPKAVILNVHNDYDLTQHVVADFSMKPLPPVSVKTIVNGRPQTRIVTGLKHLGDVCMRQIDVIKGDWKFVSAAIDNLKENWSGSNIFVPSDELWSAVYRQSVDVLKDVRNLFQVVHDTVEEWTRPQDVFVPPDLADLVDKNPRPLLTAAAAAPLLRRLTQIVGAVDDAVTIFQNRIASKSLGVLTCKADFLSAIAPLIQQITGLIQLDHAHVHSELLDLIVAFVQQQLETFDDTTDTPSKQLPAAWNTPAKLIDVNISKFDWFDVKHRRLAGSQVASLRSVHDRDIDNFVTLMSRLKEREVALKGGASADNIRSMLLVLIANEHPIQVWANVAATALKVIGPLTTMSAISDAIKVILCPEEYLARKAGWALAGMIVDAFLGPVEEPLKALLSAILPYVTLFDSLSVGSISEGLEYFAITSDSLSHVRVLPEMYDLLDKQVVAKKTLGKY